MVHNPFDENSMASICFYLGDKCENVIQGYSRSDAIMLSPDSAIEWLEKDKPSLDKKIQKK